ncbi:MAG: hypothetical protein H0U21_17265 [Acidimicrobiia bacterium]|nr:hypothetical protein [Acidimicrobiia bacterium]
MTRSWRFGRFLTAPAVVGEHAIGTGEKVFLLWGSANRDTLDRAASRIWVSFR